VLFVNRRTRNTGAELPVELGTRPGPVTKIRYRWVCEKPFDLLLNLGTLSGSTIYTYAAEPTSTAVYVRVARVRPYTKVSMQQLTCNIDETAHPKHCIHVCRYRIFLTIRPARDLWTASRDSCELEINWWVALACPGPRLRVPDGRLTDWWENSS
jgi:hypothetical protein